MIHYRTEALKSKIDWCRCCEFFHALGWYKIATNKGLRGSEKSRRCRTWQRWSLSPIHNAGVQDASTSTHIHFKFLVKRAVFFLRSFHYHISNIFQTFSNQPQLQLEAPGGPRPCVTSLGASSCASGETSWTPNSAGPGCDELNDWKRPQVEGW